jgi:hypothetical protein
MREEINKKEYITYIMYMQTNPYKTADSREEKMKCNEEKQQF